MIALARVGERKHVPDAVLRQPLGVLRAVPRQEVGLHHDRWIAFQLRRALEAFSRWQSGPTAGSRPKRESPPSDEKGLCMAVCVCVGTSSLP